MKIIKIAQQNTEDYSDLSRIPPMQTLDLDERMNASIREKESAIVDVQSRKIFDIMMQTVENTSKALVDRVNAADTTQSFAGEHYELGLNDMKKELMDNIAEYIKNARRALSNRINNQVNAL